MTHNYRFKVWDPELGGEDSGDELEASTAQDAAEDFAEQDHEGQRDGIYCDPSGRLLHVRNAEHEVWEVRVVVESMPLAVTMKAGRL